MSRQRNSGFFDDDQKTTRGNKKSGPAAGMQRNVSDGNTKPGSTPSKAAVRIDGPRLNGPNFGPEGAPYHRVPPKNKQGGYY